MLAVGELADAIMSLSKVRIDGSMDFGRLEMYANALKTTENEVDDMFDEALDMLENEGRIEVEGNDYYDKEQSEAYHEADEDHEQERFDDAQSYWNSVWRS